MPAQRAFVAAISVVALSSCAGERTTAPIPPATPTPVLLRDIEFSRLPSPYYHFEYDPTGRASKVSFASGLTMYNVSYDGDRIAEMRDSTIADRDRLVYVYDDQARVMEVRYTDEADLVYTIVSFTYDGRKLAHTERNRMLGDDFVIDKTTTLSYYPDGNLRELTEHRPAIDGFQTETTITDRYERYDDKVNVDAFSLLHTEFFDHLIFLPDVRIQNGNPGRVTRTGDSDNYIVDFTYTYDGRDRPLTRTGDVSFSSGAQAGQKFQVLANYSYY